MLITIARGAGQFEFFELNFEFARMTAGGFPFILSKHFCESAKTSEEREMARFNFFGTRGTDHLARAAGIARNNAKAATQDSTEQQRREARLKREFAVICEAAHACSDPDRALARLFPIVMQAYGGRVGFDANAIATMFTSSWRKAVTERAEPPRIDPRAVAARISRAAAKARAEVNPEDPKDDVAAGIIRAGRRARGDLS